MRKSATVLDAALFCWLLIFPFLSRAQVAVEPIPEIPPSTANGNRLQNSVSNAENLPDRETIDRGNKDREYERGLQEARDKDAAARRGTEKPASTPAGPQAVTPTTFTFAKPEIPAKPEPSQATLAPNPAGPNEQEYVRMHSSPSHPSSDPITDKERRERAVQVAQEKAAADKAAADKAAADKAAADKAAREQRDAMREFNDGLNRGGRDTPSNGSPERGGGYRDVPDRPGSSNKS